MMLDNQEEECIQSKQQLILGDDYPESIYDYAIEKDYPEYMMKLYFLVLGMTNILPIYVVLSLSDFFDAKYASYDFNFYSFLPTTAAIPFAFFLFFLVSKISLNSILIIFSVASVVLSLCVPLIPIFGSGTLTEFIALLVIYAVATTALYIFQNSSTSINGWFLQQYSDYFFTGCSFSNFVVIIFRMTLVYLNIKGLYQVSPIFGYRYSVLPSIVSCF